MSVPWKAARKLGGIEDLLWSTESLVDETFSTAGLLLFLLQRFIHVGNAKLATSHSSFHSFDGISSMRDFKETVADHDSGERFVDTFD